MRRIVGALAAMVVAMHGMTAGAIDSTCDGVQATIVGTDGDDEIDGTSRPDVIVAGAGFDRVRGFEGDDRICGGPGGDVIGGGLGNDRIFGGAGSDIISDPAGRNVIEGGDGGDEIRPGAGNDTVRGQSGDDRIRPSGGVDQLNGGEGVDTIDASMVDLDFSDVDPETPPEGVTIDFITGIYELGDFEFGRCLAHCGRASIAGFEDIVGTVGTDTLTGDDGPNTIDGGWCDDVITGNGGDDTLLTQTGDVFFAVDACVGATSPARALLFGGDGDDALEGTPLEAEGGAGDDQFLPFTSEGRFSGGAGFDSIDYSTLPERVRVDLEDGTADKMVPGGIGGGTVVAHDMLGDIEQVTGTEFADTLIASSAGSVLVGGDGDDRLLGLGGADTLRPGPGADDVDGGAGVDVVDFSDSDSASGVSVDLRGGSARIVIFTGSGKNTTFETVYDRVVGVEAVVGTSSSDTLAGDGNANYLQGGDGNDLIQGRGGDDVLDGGSGNDRCVGGAGTDIAVTCETVLSVP